MDTPISTLRLSTRPLTILEREGLKTVEQLCRMTRPQLSLCRGAGERVVAEIENALANRGLTLKGRMRPLDSDLPAAPEDMVQTTDANGLPRPNSDTRQFTNWMRANVLHGVLLSQMSEEDKRGLIDALFSQWQ